MDQEAAVAPLPPPFSVGCHSVLAGGPEGKEESRGSSGSSPCVSRLAPSLAKEMAAREQGEWANAVAVEGQLTVLEVPRLQERREIANKVHATEEEGAVEEVETNQHADAILRAADSFEEGQGQVVSRPGAAPHAWAGRYANVATAVAVNKRLVAATTMDELLETVASELARSSGPIAIKTPAAAAVMHSPPDFGASASVPVASVLPFSAINVSTALNRLGKLFDPAAGSRVGVSSTSERFAVARRKEVVAVVEAAMDLLPVMHPQTLANSALGMSKIAAGSSIWMAEMDRLAAASAKSIMDYDIIPSPSSSSAPSQPLLPQHLANMAAAFAILRHDAPTLFDSITSKSQSLMQSFLPLELSQILWACAVLDQPCRSLLDAFIFEQQQQQQEKEAEAYSPRTSDERLSLPRHQLLDFECWCERSLANVMWSLTVLDELDHPFFRQLSNHVFSDEGAYKFLQRSTREASRNRHLSQLQQVLISLLIADKATKTHPHVSEDKEGKSSPVQGTGLRSRKRKIRVESRDSREEDVVTLLAAMESAWKKEMELPRQPSAKQMEVERLLTTTSGYSCWLSEAAPASAWGYSLDLCLPQSMVVVEMDGPSHFTRNTGQPLGSTLLKRRQLAAAGWRVISIPYFEWDELDGEEEQQHYLQHCLLPLL